MADFRAASSLILPLLCTAVSAFDPVETRIKATGTVTSNDGRTITMATVAEFVPRRLGEDGLRKLHRALRDHQVDYHTSNYAATFLMVMPDQVMLARKLLKQLVETDKLRITIYDEAK